MQLNTEYDQKCEGPALTSRKILPCAVPNAVSCLGFFFPKTKEALKTPCLHQNARSKMTEWLYHTLFPS